MLSPGSRLIGVMLFVASLLMPIDAFAVAELSITKIEIGGKTVSDHSKIYTANESATIKISFKYRAESDTEVQRWKCYIGTSESGTSCGGADFSGDSASVSFTTVQVADWTQGTSEDITLGEIYYSYGVYLKIEWTTGTTTTDGDNDDDYESSYNSSSDVENRPSRTVTIHIDKDPPGIVQLHDNPVPSESRLKVSWDAITKSMNDNPESGVNVKFCVEEAGEVGEEENTALLTAAVEIFEFKAGDGDEETDGDIDEEGDLDDMDIADTDDGEPEETETESEFEIEQEFIPADGDDDPEEAEPAVVDGDGAEEEGSVDETCANVVESGGVSGSSYTIKGLNNNVRYKIRAKGIDLAGNTSPYWSDPIYGTPLVVDDFWERYKKAGGNEKGGFCFIAMAAYGSYSAPEVKLLRKLRDRVLVRFWLGRKFIESYYRYGSIAGKPVAGNPVLAYGVRAALFPLVAVLAFAFKLGLWSQIFILLMGLSIMLAVRRFIPLDGKESRP